MADIVMFRAFVPWQHLSFDLRQLLEQTVAAWARGRPLPEGYEDAVVDEMDRLGLRLWPDDADEALFHRGRSKQDYRQCIVAALQTLTTDSSGPRTTEDVETYHRPCGE